MGAGLIILVTGATRGIGRALAEELAGRGHTVYGAGRSWSAVDGPRFRTVKLDVTDAAAVTAAVGKIVAGEGRLDVVVNNAGVGHAGPVEDTDLDTVRRIFETNYLAPVSLIQAALPTMRAAGRGLIVNVTSAAGQIGVPFQAHYAASKFALEGLSESLFHELQPFGIRVVIVEPGDVGTSIWKDTQARAVASPAYREAIERFFRVKEKEMGAAAALPEPIAREIAAIIENPGPGLRYPVPAQARWFLLARKFLPERLFLFAVGRNYHTKG